MQFTFSSPGSAPLWDRGDELDARIAATLLWKTGRGEKRQKFTAHGNAWQRAKPRNILHLFCSELAASFTGFQDDHIFSYFLHIARIYLPSS